MKRYRTSEIARLTGVHPNTIRLYEEWGILPPVPRESNGYRVYREFHLDQVRVARLVYHNTFLGGEIRKVVIAAMRHAGKGELAEAEAQAREHLRLILHERNQAQAAAEVLEHWVKGAIYGDQEIQLKSKEAAAEVGVSYDILRNWERDGLIQVPRNQVNGYRVFGRVELNRLRVIRTLRLARYSVMAILRMLKKLDEGQSENLVEVLDTPEDEEDIVYATDRWLSTLVDLENTARELVAHLHMMQKKAEDPEYLHDLITEGER